MTGLATTGRMAEQERIRERARRLAKQAPALTAEQARIIALLRPHSQGVRAG